MFINTDNAVNVFVAARAILQLVGLTGCRCRARSCCSEPDAAGWLQQCSVDDDQDADGPRDAL